MSLELWLWFAAWVVLSEIGFIILCLFDSDEWFFHKLKSFILCGVIMFVHFLIGTGTMFEDCSLNECQWVVDYSVFLYELYVILTIGLFIGANYGIVKLIDKIKKRKKKRW